MKNLKRVFCILTIVCVLCSASLTVFARNLYEQVKYLDDQEIFDEIWDSVLSNTKTGKENETGNTFLISYYYQDLKEFLSNYKIPDGDFKLADLRDVYYDRMADGDTAVVPYSQKVMDYVDSHSNIELEWSFDDSKIKYICYAKGEKIDTFYSDVFVEYSKKNVSEKSYWTYDESSDSYVNKDENGKTLKSIERYHLPDEDKAVSQNSAENSNGSGTVSDDDDTVSEGSASYSDNAVSADDGDSSVGSGDYQLATAENDSAAVSAKDEEEPEEDNSVTGTVLAIIGGLIVVGLGVLGYMMFRKKKEDGNGK